MSPAATKGGSKDAASYAEAAARDRLKTLLAKLGRARRDPGNPEMIHDLRVSIRRFTQCVRAFRGVFGRPHARKMRRRLRKLMDRCGAVRNCDVAMEVLDAARAPSAGSLKRSLRARRTRAASELAVLLEDWKSGRKTRHWRGWLRAQSPHQSAAAMAGELLPPLAREVFRAGAAAAKPGTHPRQLHQLRLLAKRFRYVLELFGNVYGVEFERGLQELRGLQDRLGTINDCATASMLLSGPGGRSAARERARAAVKRLLRERVREFQVYWRGTFALSNRRWWLAWIENPKRHQAKGRKP